MKFILFILTIFMITGCSTSSINHAWSNTKRASYNATTDYVTWGALLSASLIYAGDCDDDITNYFMDNEILKKEDDEIYRDINGYETFLTALFIEDDSYTTKGKRVLVEAIAFKAGIEASSMLNMIDKTSPGGSYDSSVGSLHAVSPFCGSAMTRRNVDQLSIPTWGKYTLNTISYSTATASALTRVQDGGHSFADQLVSVSVGNFIGLFFHDAFMLDDNTIISTSLNDDSTNIQLSFSY